MSDWAGKFLRPRRKMELSNFQCRLHEAATRLQLSPRRLMVALICGKSPRSHSARELAVSLIRPVTTTDRGQYVYPTNGSFNPGAFDLTGLDVFTDGDDVLFVARIAGEVRNPFGGDKISLQRFNVYLGLGTGSSVPALPGTNMNTASPWLVAIVGDGRFNTAGAYTTAGLKTASATLLTVPQTHQIAVVVPRSALGGLDLSTARYGVAMFGNSEAGEGIGFVRPVYSFEFWNNPPPGLEFVKSFRFGGGAGELDFGLESKDTDTRDPNALDVIVGPGQSQSSVLDWQTASPVQLPMLELAP